MSLSLLLVSTLAVKGNRLEQLYTAVVGLVLSVVGLVLCVVGLVPCVVGLVPL